MKPLIRRDAVALALGLEGSEKQDLVNEELSKIDAGKVQQLLTNFQECLGSRKALLTAKGQERLSRLCKYLQSFSDCINYHRLLSLGLPIGSGEIESAHRYIPQKRLKIPGATWHPDNINPMLGLLILQANNAGRIFGNLRPSEQKYQGSNNHTFLLRSLTASRLRLGLKYAAGVII